jgi:hypothetical protein
MHLGPSGEAKTRRARPPISAERTTFASATTAAGSEVAEDILLAHTARRALGGNLIRQTEKHLALDVRWEISRTPRQEEPRRPTFAGDQDDVVGAEHLARAIPEVTNRHHSHVITSVVTL